MCYYSIPQKYHESSLDVAQVGMNQFSWSANKVGLIVANAFINLDPEGLMTRGNVD